ncbi:ShlB/FhaC/HecB family hemolysin secretion/activation protein [Limnohabitans sp. DCL3]|uniref:ShlB/FhaC/HecB family hemolysin secretion/activation protein n=1 Tax=Limnohabitans sp. DCL3 TaxID=3374103 RepID=UPI003A870317
MHTPPHLITALLAALPMLATAAAPDAGALLQQLEARPAAALFAPALQTPVVPTPPAADHSGPVLRVNAFVIEGATLLSPTTLLGALRGFTGQDLSLTQLQEAAWVLVQTYREAGWLVNAWVPQQEIDAGVVKLRVVEARLGQVRFQYPESPLPRDRIQAMAQAQLVSGLPLNLHQVDRLLLLLDDLPGVVAMATFAQGTEAGSTDVLVTLGAGKTLDANITADNFGSPSTGAHRISAILSFHNPTGAGDALQLQAVATDGSRYGRLAFTWPVGPQGARLGGHLSDMRYQLVGSFASLQASGSAQSWGADLSAPLIRQPERNLSAQLSTDRKRFDNQALASTGDAAPTTVSHYQLDVLRMGLVGNWIDRTGRVAQNTASVQSSWGRVDLKNSPNATADATSANTAGAFHKLNAQFNREQSLTGQTSWYLQAAAQWANRNLDSSEKIYLGGATGVRAYPSNEAGGSTGTTLSTGLKHRIDQAFTLNAFADWGRVQVYPHNVNTAGSAISSVNTQTLKGAGLSLNWRNLQGQELAATLSRRHGINPAAHPTTGADSDGTRTLNRLWLSAALNF